MILSFMFLCLIGEAYAYATGAPNSTCVTMLPQHNGYTKQETVSPYTLKATLNLTTKGIKAEVQILSFRSYKGFLLIGTSEAGGGFTLIKTTAKYICNVNRGITHTSNDIKYNETFTWDIPVTNCGNILFNATIVQDYKTFWVGITSNILKINCTTTKTTTTTTTTATSLPQSTTSRRPPTSTLSPSTTTSTGPPTTTLPPSTTNGAPKMRGTNSFFVYFLFVFIFYWI